MIIAQFVDGPQKGTEKALDHVTSQVVFPVMEYVKSYRQTSLGSTATLVYEYDKRLSECRAQYRFAGIDFGRLRRTAWDRRNDLTVALSTDGEDRMKAVHQLLIGYLHTKVVTTGELGLMLDKLLDVYNEADGYTR